MRYVRVERAGATLAGSYSPGGATAVVAIHGAAEGTRDWYLYHHLHDVLPAAGIGVLTFDRRGEGESTGEPSRGRFAVQADDALAFAHALEVERVGLWGISQGGWVGPLAAARSERVAFLVLLASTGVTPAEQMRYAVAEQIRRAGFGPDAVARAVELRARAEGWIRRHNDLGADLAAAAREPWWPLTFLPEAGPPDAEADAVRQELAEELFFDPEPVFAQVRVPTLLFYGDDDSWTPVEPSIDAWRRARGEEVEIVVLAGTGHEPTYSDASISLEYERKLVEWLKAQP
ncbi:MAG: alpha/beta hydrolase [Actinomycetota bacterium]|nr:alpha/beta hydrolase [Actinomycetota bacterium]